MRTAVRLASVDRTPQRATLPPSPRSAATGGARHAGAVLAHDLSRVRVRSVAEDAPRARALGALAYTVSETVHVPPGLERPRTRAGRELLAHETVHARQWLNGRAQPGPPWPRTRLEEEAQRLAPQVARGASVTVLGRHRGDAALCHPVFISTHGRRAYLDVAEQFYRRWGYGTPVRIGSIEEMLENLAGGTGPLARVTLVSHAVPSNINASFLRGGPGFVLESDWALDTLEELPQLARHVTADTFLEEVLQALRADAAARPMLEGLGLRGADADPIGREYVWWLLDAWFIRNQRAGGRAARRARDAVAEAADRWAQTYRDLIAVATAATAGLGSGGPTLSTEAFERHFARVLQDFSPGRASVGAARRLVGSFPNQAVGRILGTATRGEPTFFDHLETVRGRLGAASHVEVQGCRVGGQPGYLAAMSSFFNGARVTAPDWFQIFGHVGFRQVARDDDRTMRSLWRERAVRAALAHWAPILAGTPLPETPGWEDLAAFLRAGHPLVVGRRLLLTRPMGEAALLEFLARHGYRITAQDELREAFVEGRNLRDATRHALVDWLQENRDGRGGVAFRPDPLYRAHIRSSR